MADQKSKSPLAGKHIAIDGDSGGDNTSKNGLNAQDSYSDRQLGESVRALRKRANLSLKLLSEQTGLSTGMISQIERGLSTPSLRSLRLLSLALNAPISRFFEERTELRLSRFIVRREERRRLNLTRSGLLKHLLSPDEPGVLELYELELAPGASSGVGYRNPQGEKAGFILSGRLHLWLAKEKFVLGPGDTFRVPSAVPHLFKNSTSETTRLIWITATPPWPQADAPAV
ncbi:MAG: helix-turn-helix domain-containing protein [Pollutimonas bauzanensis]|uniref:Helix-turn-helix n=1 Tax=Pollutimonas bauzanensis TaxID=658167 RepID=A0A1M5ZNM3_9BURK|nr:XRE family transcriptional regulator [Pollutimonas bauzanensis]SHI25696.1 Helix-turn-helix [Pollutimonas bauzanensis]